MNETKEVGSTMPSLLEASEQIVAAATQEEKDKYIGLSLEIPGPVEDQDAEVEEKDEDDDPFGALLAEESESPFKFTKEWDDFGMRGFINEDYNDKPFRFSTNLEDPAQEVEAKENIVTATAVETGEEIIEKMPEKKEPDTAESNLEQEVDESKEQLDSRSPRRKKRNESGLVSSVFGSLFHQEEVEVDVPDLSQSPASLPDLTNRESDQISDEFNLDEEDSGVSPLKIELDIESTKEVANMVNDDSFSAPDGTDEEEAWESAQKTLSLGASCISESYAPELNVSPYRRREIWSISAQLSQSVSPKYWKNETVRESVSSEDNSTEGMFRYLLSVLEKLDDDTTVIQLKRLEGILAKQLSTERVINAEREELQKKHLDLVRRTAEAMTSMKLNLGTWATLS